jgi:hypothetical protein
MARGTVLPRTPVVVLAPRVVARVPIGAGGRSCEAETCREDSSCRELVGDAANWLEIGRLASVGLDRGP